MHIYAVCGMGIGTSVLLKMNAEKALTQMGFEAIVIATDISTAKQDESKAQIILTTPELVDQLSGIRAEIVSIENVFDLGELTEKLTKSLL